jgi:hypothetical protein
MARSKGTFENGSAIAHTAEAGGIGTPTHVHVQIDAEHTLQTILHTARLFEQCHVVHSGWS